jgi:Bacterial aa3 type cytochrome c oxidase subunit IV
MRPIGRLKRNQEGFVMGASNNAGNNMKAATATYEGFVSMIKISTPVILAIVAFVMYLIA